jgi:hypothetical protein
VASAVRVLVSPDASFVLSALLHGGFLMAAALMAPVLGCDLEDAISSDQFYCPQILLVGAEREEDDPTPSPAESDPDGRERPPFACHDCQGGSAAPRAPNDYLRYGLPGRAENPAPHFGSRAATPSPEFGLPLQDPSGSLPDVPWGNDHAFGNPPISRARSGQEEIGMASGSPGAGLGLRSPCPTCGGMGNGTFLVREGSGSAGGGGTGTERASSP